MDSIDSGRRIGPAGYINLEQMVDHLSRDDLYAPTEIEPLCYITPFFSVGETLYIVENYGPIQFIHGDRPQEVFSHGEAVLVRNHRFKSGFSIRTNGMISHKQLSSIVNYFFVKETWFMRNEDYLRNKDYLGESIVGHNYGTAVMHLENKHPICPMNCYDSIAIYNMALMLTHTLLAQDPVKVFEPTRQPDRNKSPGFGRNKYQARKLTSSSIASTPTSSVCGSRLRPEAPAFVYKSRSISSVDSFKSDGFNEELKNQKRVNGSMEFFPYASDDQVGSPSTESANGNFKGNSTSYRTGGGNSNRLQPKAGLNKDNNDRYKTELCKNWSERGECRYGRSCQFAHGQDELRPMKRHPLWKTKTCLAWANGGCVYSHRCCYAHEWLPNNGGHPPHIELDVIRRHGTSTKPKEQEENLWPKAPTTPKYLDFFDKRNWVKKCD